MLEIPVAEAGIRQLHARYMDALWRKDTGAFVRCFTEDAEWTIARMHLRGREEIGAAFEQLIAPSERVLMTITIPLLEFQPGAAAGTVHVTESVKRAEGNMRTLGVYQDRYVGEGLDWMFQSRFWTIHYRGPMDLSAPLVDDAPL